jgi:hypothetical protein
VAVTLIEPLPVPEEDETVHQLWLLLAVQFVLDMIAIGKLGCVLVRRIYVDDTVRVAGVTVSVARLEKTSV